MQYCKGGVLNLLVDPILQNRNPIVEKILHIGKNK